MLGENTLLEQSRYIILYGPCSYGKDHNGYPHYTMYAIKTYYLLWTIIDLASKLITLTYLACMSTH